MNNNDKRRHEILGLFYGADYDCEHFNDLTLKQLEILFKEDFIDPEDAQNDSPTNEEFFEFMRENKRFTCHGYIITPKRDDYRVSLEGVKLSKKPTQKEKDKFVNLFRLADEFECSNKGCFCWYD